MLENYLISLFINTRAVVCNVAEVETAGSPSGVYRDVNNRENSA